MHTPAVFYVRPLLWDELKRSANPAEINELRHVLGTRYIDENEGLNKELQAFVQILGDYQRQNDCIREAIVSRPALPEPPGRALLLDQLKLLASNLTEKNKPLLLRSERDKALFGYILHAQDEEQQNESSFASSSGLVTPRMKDYHVSVYPPSDQGVLIRPGTADKKRPSTAQSRPPSRSGLLSRGSTASIASAPAVLEDLGCVDIRQIDAVKDKLRDALLEENSQLLDDIDFIQGCLDMEQDLIEEDTRKAPAPLPSMKDLNDFRRALEEAWIDQDEQAQLQDRMAKADETIERRRLGLDECKPKPPPSDAPRGARPTPGAPKKRSSSFKVHRVRELVQNVRDEPFLS
ncbi:hypothetical protein SDRG_10229 [Saprolegnia diclina VS20]|uniref:Uncharacterized protein n=1 Tax=Saprolegnia diclina (strain VS20) TaxID=1156394 RepID=T0QEP0_SAPDV|nr:hypothetical protein SDRG_10229 [Saprolegnia diclina VS20]EQC32030.1 hypothetical protein SDRG_10229 [Saprolegnia diclina VS20]|eukprot:XP_008614432.1 hypothetical protein SDRG_10229 [Saprolegnia diclina VS20]